jgi:hypothetical protein
MRVEFLCIDCGCDTVKRRRGRNEYYMVRDDVWTSARMQDGMLCIGCLEARLGRRLMAHDFIDAPINDPSPLDTPRGLLNERAHSLVSASVERDPRQMLLLTCAVSSTWPQLKVIDL